MFGYNNKKYSYEFVQINLKQINIAIRNLKTLPCAVVLLEPFCVLEVDLVSTRVDTGDYVLM